MPRSGFLSLLLLTSLSLPSASNAVDPYALADAAWISISGTVEAVQRDAFELSYGRGTITVEMDDGDRDADAYVLVPGDEVTVSGVIDDGFYERTTIEAASVYVEKLGTYFESSAVDEEDDFVTLRTPVDVSYTIVQGRVEETGADEFVIDTGARDLTVDVTAMVRNPLDPSAYRRVEEGDVVSVTGEMGDGLLEGGELVASSVVTLLNGRP